MFTREVIIGSGLLTDLLKVLEIATQVRSFLEYNLFLGFGGAGLDGGSNAAATVPGLYPRANVYEYPGVSPQVPR